MSPTSTGEPQCAKCGTTREPVTALEALRYIDEVCVSLEPGKNAAYLGALRDVRVSIAASIERLQHGGRMESTSDLMGTVPTDAGRVGVLTALRNARVYVEETRWLSRRGTVKTYCDGCGRDRGDGCLSTCTAEAILRTIDAAL
jgi:hypothetical protein